MAGNSEGQTAPRHKIHRSGRRAPALNVTDRPVERQYTSTSGGSLQIGTLLSVGPSSATLRSRTGRPLSYLRCVGLSLGSRTVGRRGIASRAVPRRSELKGSIRQPARLVLVAVSVAWLLFPILLWGSPSRDVAPFVAAAHLVRTHPGAVYTRQGPPGQYRTDPLFDREFCRSTGYRDCSVVTTPYIASPLALGPSAILAALPPRWGVLLIRLGAAMAFVVGMELSWRRWGHRSTQHAWVLAASALGLTGMVVNSLALGQTSPLLFLLVALGLTSPRPARARLTGTLLAAAIALKTFPLLVVPVLMLRRDWRAVRWLGASLALITSATLIIAPREIWVDFIHGLRAIGVGGVLPHFNASIDELVASVWSSYTGRPTLAAGFVLARFGVMVWLFRRFALRGPPDLQWSLAWLATLVVSTQVWPHYLPIVVAAIGHVAMRSRTPIWVMPIAAVAISVTPLFKTISLQLLAIATIGVGVVTVLHALRPCSRPVATA
jgi:hypothetical protein